MRLRLIVCLAAVLAAAGCMGSGHAPTTPHSATRAAPVSAPLASASVSALLNRQRATAGLPALSRSRQLDAVAMVHARDQAERGFFGHVGSDGSTVHGRVTAAGYPSCLSAENIAMGQGSEAAVMSDWMGSSGHRANILHPRAEQFGFARVGDTWVMVLARPC